MLVAGLFLVAVSFGHCLFAPAMEFMLLPVHRGDPPIPVPQTPYLCRERYDGGPWMTYPQRKGKTITAWNGTEVRISGA